MGHGEQGGWETERIVDRIRTWGLPKVPKANLPSLFHPREVRLQTHGSIQNRGYLKDTGK